MAIKRYAQIKDDVVVNVVLCDSKDIALIKTGVSKVVPSDTANPGDTYDGENFTPPEDDQS